MEENCAAAQLVLSANDIAELDERFRPDVAMGERYTQEGMKGVGV